MMPCPTGSCMGPGTPTLSTWGACARAPGDPSPKFPIVTRATTITNAASRAICSPPPSALQLNALRALPALESPSRTHPSTDAHRGDAVPGTTPPQLVQQRDRDPGAATPQGVPQGDGAPVDVEPFL